MAQFGLLILLLFNVFQIESNPMKADWIQKAFDAHKKVVEQAKDKTADIPELERKHPLQDLFDKDVNDGIPKKKPMVPPQRKTLDPLNIINKADYDNNPFDNALEMRDSETQHSFQHPLDMISQNWILIGDAVATTNFARLTPEDGGRRGVIWNKFGLHLDNWQIMMEINIHSRNKLSGDGFGVFILDENEINRAQLNNDQMYDNEVLLGEFYGLRQDFNGTGVIFDTFDNDNNGDNPVVFTVTNDGKRKIWNMNTDLGEMREKLKSESGADILGVNSLFPTECTLDYHGKESAKILIRYQDGKLAVYTDKEHKKVEGTEADKLNLLRKHALPFAFGRHLGIAKMLGKMGMG